MNKCTDPADLPDPVKFVSLKIIWFTQLKQPYKIIFIQKKTA